MWLVRSSPPLTPPKRPVEDGDQEGKKKAPTTTIHEYRQREESHRPEREIRDKEKRRKKGLGRPPDNRRGTETGAGGSPDNFPPVVAFRARACKIVFNQRARSKQQETNKKKKKSPTRTTKKRVVSCIVLLCSACFVPLVAAGFLFHTRACHRRARAMAASLFPFFPFAGYRTTNTPKKTHTHTQFTIRAHLRSERVRLLL